MTNSKFNFLNFEPSDELAQRATQILNDILESAPDDSQADARVAKHDKGFEASVEIFSKAGHFVARAFDIQPQRALNLMLRKIEDRLDQWKEERIFFQDPSEYFDQWPKSIETASVHERRPQ